MEGHSARSTSFNLREDETRESEFHLEFEPTDPDQRETWEILKKITMKGQYENVRDWL